MVVRFDLAPPPVSPGLHRRKAPSKDGRAPHRPRSARPKSPTRYQRHHDLSRPLCPQCGERDRVVMTGESFFGGGECPDPFCERCMGFLETLEPRPGRYRSLGRLCRTCSGYTANNGRKCTSCLNRGGA